MTGVVLLRTVQSGAASTRRHASTAAVIPGSRWTFTPTSLSDFVSPLLLSRFRPSSARSPGAASNRGRVKVMWTAETLAPVVSKWTTRVSSSSMPVSATGSPRRTVTVYSVLRASGLSGT